MEGMFKDIELSKDVMSNYADYLVASPVTPKDIHRISTLASGMSSNSGGSPVKRSQASSLQPEENNGVGELVSLTGESLEVSWKPMEAKIQVCWIRSFTASA